MFTRHVRRSPITAVAWFTMLACFVLTACGDGGSADHPSATSPPEGETVPTSPGRHLADQVGCTATSESENPYWETRWGFDESLDCELDGLPSARLHTFAPDRYDQVRQALSTRYGDSGNPCPDGSAPVSPWIVLGAEWAVVTSREDVALDLVERLDGQLLDGGGGTEGTPVSYPGINDACSL